MRIDNRDIEILLDDIHVTTEVHVLLVENSGTHARILERLLGHRVVASDGTTFRVTRARNLQEARSLVHALHDLDVISLELDLPDSTGLDTYRAMAATAPHLPIVVMTGSTDDEVEFATLAQGAQGHLVKSRTSARSYSRALVVAIRRHQLASRMYTQLVGQPG